MLNYLKYIKVGLQLTGALVLLYAGWYWRGVYEENLQLKAKEKAFDRGSEVMVEFEYIRGDNERKIDEIFSEFERETPLSECVLSDNDVAFIERLRSEFP